MHKTNIRKWARWLNKNWRTQIFGEYEVKTSYIKRCINNGCNPFTEPDSGDDDAWGLVPDAARFDDLGLGMGVCAVGGGFVALGITQEMEDEHPADEEWTRNTEIADICGIPEDIVAKVIIMNDDWHWRFRKIAYALHCLADGLLTSEQFNVLQDNDKLPVRPRRERTYAARLKSGELSPVDRSLLQIGGNLCCVGLSSSSH